MKQKRMYLWMYLEWLRTRTAFFVLVGLSIALLATEALKLSRELPYFYHGLLIGYQQLLPFCAALLLAAGIVSDDRQNRTMVQHLALPISRDRMWWSRLLFRLLLFIVFHAYWLLVVVPSTYYTYRGLFAIFHDLHSAYYMVLTSFLFFATTVFFAVLLGHLVPALVGGCSLGVGILLIMQQAFPHHGPGAYVFALGVLVVLVLAGRDLFVGGLPLDYRSLWPRALAWIGGIALLSGGALMA